MPGPQQLGELQLAILRVLWDHGECSVVDVQQHLAPERRLAPTTVATTLTGLEKQDLVQRRSEGRKYLYQAAIQAEESSARQVKELVNRVFLGKTGDLLNHLLDDVDIDADELDHLRQKIEQLRKKSPNDS